MSTVLEVCKRGASEGGREEGCYEVGLVNRKWELISDEGAVGVRYSIHRNGGPNVEAKGIELYPPASRARG